MSKKEDKSKLSDEEIERKAEEILKANGNEAENEDKAENLKEADGKKVPSELDAARAAAEEYKRKWYAVAAEYDNYRKRTQTQAAQAYQDGKAEAVLKLLPVADTFGYAYDGASDEKTRAGIDKIVKNFNAILASMGIEEIPISVGDKFDESVAEAVMNAPAQDGEEVNVIKIILKKGYKSGDKVIRYAQVSVTV